MPAPTRLLACGTRFWAGCRGLLVGIVRAREILVALVILTVFCLGITQASAGEPPPPVICVSAVGPVDVNGHGVTTPVKQGDCP
jgi:hypothetical protein